MKERPPPFVSLGDEANAWAWLAWALSRMNDESAEDEAHAAGALEYIRALVARLRSVLRTDERRMTASLADKVVVELLADKILEALDVGGHGGNRLVSGGREEVVELLREALGGSEKKQESAVKIELPDGSGYDERRHCLIFGHEPKMHDLASEPSRVLVGVTVQDQHHGRTLDASVCKRCGVVYFPSMKDVF